MRGLSCETETRTASERLHCELHREGVEYKTLLRGCREMNAESFALFHYRCLT